MPGAGAFTKINGNFLCVVMRLTFALGRPLPYNGSALYNGSTERGHTMQEKRIRIVDIAERLGLSTATVSNVIHGKPSKMLSLIHI